MSLRSLIEDVATRGMAALTDAVVLRRCEAILTAMGLPGAVRARSLLAAAYVCTDALASSTASELAGRAFSAVRAESARFQGNGGAGEGGAEGGKEGGGRGEGATNQEGEKGVDGAALGRAAREALADEQDAEEAASVAALGSALDALRAEETPGRVREVLRGLKRWKDATRARTLQYTLDSATQLRAAQAVQRREAEAAGGAPSSSTSSSTASSTPSPASPEPGVARAEARMEREARALGGEEAVRQLMGRLRSRPMARADVEATLRRAYWDSMLERVGRGEVEPLWDSLRELRDNVDRLLFMAPRARERFGDGLDVDLLRQQVHLADFGQTLGQSIRHTVRVLGECSAAADAPLVRALEQLCESGMDGRATLDYLRDAETGIVPTFLRPAHELAEVCRRRLESIVQGGDGSLREEGRAGNGTDRKT